jgi:hypothetical protein
MAFGGITKERECSINPKWKMMFKINALSSKLAYTYPKTRD